VRHIDQPNAAGDSLLLECIYMRHRDDEPWPAWPVLQLLMNRGATAWTSNSRTKQTLLHIWMQQDRFDIVRDILMERLPWADLLPRLEWWAPNSKGQTPLGIAEAAAKAVPRAREDSDREIGSKGKDTIAVAKLIPVLHQHWQKTERPLLAQSLVEHATLCTDVAQLVLSYIDGQERARV
jgi:hypothetical protein